ncbi:hypothetical protein M0804_009175 [Polistes exclamans]|nr:hypothetical protein M0804_009175 [Polistes exclamans]
MMHWNMLDDPSLLMGDLTPSISSSSILAVRGRPPPRFPNTKTTTTTTTTTTTVV